MEKKHINALIDLGLNEHEARVYLAILALGLASVARIAQSADVKRTTVYSVIELLKRKGLISVEMHGWKEFFVAASPDKLEAMLELKKNNFKKVFPEISALYETKPSGAFIKYYEGLESIKSAYENLLNSVKPHEEYLVLSDTETWSKADEKYFSKFVERRSKLNIKVRLLLQNSEKARYYKKYEKNFNFKVKILPDKTKLTTNLNLIPSKVLIHQLADPAIALVIENKSIIQMHKEIFEMLWNSLPE